MDFSMHLTDIAVAVGRQEQPTVMLPRKQGKFWVPGSPLNVATIEWSPTTKGEFVRVPLFGYCVTGEQNGATLSLLAMECGMRAMLSPPAGLPQDGIIATLVCGSQFQKAKAGWVIYLGMALCITAS